MKIIVKLIFVFILISLSYSTFGQCFGFLNEQFPPEIIEVHLEMSFERNREDKAKEDLKIKLRTEMSEKILSTVKSQTTSEVVETNNKFSSYFDSHVDIQSSSNLSYGNFSFCEDKSERKIYGRFTINKSQLARANYADCLSAVKGLSSEISAVYNSSNNVDASTYKKRLDMLASHKKTSIYLDPEIDVTSFDNYYHECQKSIAKLNQTQEQMNYEEVMGIISDSLGMERYNYAIKTLRRLQKQFRNDPLIQQELELAENRYKLKLKRDVLLYESNSRYEMALKEIEAYCSLLSCENEIKDIKMHIQKAYFDQNPGGKFSEQNQVVTANDKGKIVVPILSIDRGSIEFTDFNSNDQIDGNEECSISFEIFNEGEGVAFNLNATLYESNNIGINTVPMYSIGKIEPNSKKKVVIPFSGSLDLKNGKANIQINFQEKNGLHPNPIYLNISTHEFEEPDIKIVDYVFSSRDGVIKLGYPIELKAIVQNMGQGDGENVSIDFLFPEQNVFRNTDSKFEFETLKSGEAVVVVFEFVANKLYESEEIPIRIQLKEKFGRYASNKDVQTIIDSQTSQDVITIVGNTKSTPKEITEVSLRSDVDKDIPAGIAINEKKYALIIGNQDYHSHQPDLSSEVDVDFAANDARVFAEYCEKTLGYPKDNIKIVVDGTRGQMSQKLAQLVRLAEVENGQAELLFYYSGHGLPEEGTNIPYLIPVDVSGTQPTNGIALTSVYDELSKYPTVKTTVILDACFSGGARNKELVNMKGVKVKAKVDAVPGNIVVLASSSGNEASAVYREKQHGYFTYFLLKNLQTNKGQGNLETIILEVSQNVAREAARVGKNQTPNVLPGAEIGEDWKNLGW